MAVPADIDPQRVPRHVAVIMDGNGRWARQRGEERSAGHRAGADALDRLTDSALELGIGAVSVYAFSTENWRRPVGEINALFDLLGEYLERRLKSIRERGIRVLHSGSRERLPAATNRQIQKALDETSHNNTLLLNVCLNYGSRQEILRAAGRALGERTKRTRNRWERLSERLDKLDNPEKQRELIGKFLDRNLRGDKLVRLREKDLERELYTAGLGDPDLLIRTAGEYRVSNFLLWQIAYAEFWVTDTLWPDFGQEDLFAAVRDYQNRNRKFGGL